MKTLLLIGGISNIVLSIMILFGEIPHIFSLVITYGLLGVYMLSD